MTGTAAPGKQCMATLKKLMFLIMESPTIRVVGGKRGRGICDRAGECCGEAATSDLRVGFPTILGYGRLPERLSTASFRILRWEAEVVSWDGGR